MTKTLGWLGIIRLGLVQSALGAVVALTTSTLNRIMVVEMALPAVLPAALVAFHYAVQLSRPRFGYGSDIGARRTPWIVGGMSLLCLGALAATDAALMMKDFPALGLALSVIAYGMIGAGVGASGTSLLALLATLTAPSRRPAAASLTWILMIFGIVVSSIAVAVMIKPFSAQALIVAVTVVTSAAFLLTVFAVHNVEPFLAPGERPVEEGPKQSFPDAVREIWAEPLARRFTIFVFVSMLAYSAQDLIMEPFTGLVFGLTPSQSTGLSGMQNVGVLIGMILTGALGGRNVGGREGFLRIWAVAGCIGSAAMLAAMAVAARVGPGWPLAATLIALGFCNGVFAVAAIGSMMTLAGAGRNGREGTRMGVWGAAQAVAFGLGGFLGAAGVDSLRALLPNTGEAFQIVFLMEAVLFMAAAVIAAQLKPASSIAKSPAPTPAGALVQ
jgi:MFS transporter, BCD family, chlorophyll transporter